MGDPDRLPDFAIKSYRYLRLAIAVVVLSLLAAVFIERAQAPCWQVSLSAYYFTPAHAMFVGALVTIGVCLIAIRAGPDWEDMLLNVAGILAPIVAFVPTTPPSGRCASSPFGPVDTEAYIDNNVLALGIGAVVAIGTALLVARLRHKAVRPRFDAATVVGLMLSISLLVAGVVWYRWFRDSFLANAHHGAAIAMFALVGIVIAINAFSAKNKRYRRIYASLAAAMALAFIGIFAAKLLADDWRHGVLLLEIFELVPFALFWLAQTLELWEGGLRVR